MTNQGVLGTTLAGKPLPAQEERQPPASQVSARATRGRHEALHPESAAIMGALARLDQYSSKVAPGATGGARVRPAPIATLPSGTTIEAVFTGPETLSKEGRKLWSSIARLRLPDERRVVPFNASLEWPADETPYAPYFRKMFGTAQPSQSLCLLHAGPNVATARGRPLLLVHGAGDNASRCWSHMAGELDARGVPVYAITLPHPHADPRESADLIAASLEAIKVEYRARHGVELDKVDVAAHSMGSFPVLTYASNAPGMQWGLKGNDPKTFYRHDVGNLIMLGSPLDGIDTSHRWPIVNLFSAVADKAANPSAWNSIGAVSTDAQNLDGDPTDYFLGQAALVKPQPHPLPMFQPQLWPLAMLQPDAWTTYYGGIGLTTTAPGIAAAQANTGNFLDRLQAQGVDPEVRLYAVAGSRSYLFNGLCFYLDNTIGEAATSAMLYPVNLAARMMAPAAALMTGGQYSPAEMQGFLSGQFIPGEVSGPSDGVIFESSARAVDKYTKRGAQVMDVRTVGLAHTDLPIASQLSADELRGAIAADPVKYGPLEATARAYEEADMVAYLYGVLRPDAR